MVDCLNFNYDKKEKRAKIRNLSQIFLWSTKELACFVTTDQQKKVIVKLNKAIMIIPFIIFDKFSYFMGRKCAYKKKCK